MSDDREIDIVCMGRATVDLHADQLGAHLEEASTFSKYVGGSPAYVAIGAARLGLSSAMLSRVGDEAMGRFVQKTLKDEGIDISSVAVDSSRLTGLSLLGIRPPATFPLVFYRTDCADMAMEANDLDPNLFERSEALLVTGTHFSSDKMATLSGQAITLAKKAGCKIVLDIDFHPLLWGLTGIGDEKTPNGLTKQVHKKLSLILDQCDLIVGTDEELRIAADRHDINKAIAHLHTLTTATLVRQQDTDGCSVYTSDGKHPLTVPGFSVNILDILGARDAFLSGFLRGWLKGERLETSCLWGNACRALVVSRHGCSAAIPYWEELQSYLHQKGPKEILKQHCALTQKEHDTRPLCILAIDHRLFFKSLMLRYQVETDRIQIFKKLLYQALLKTLDHDIPVRRGLIVDELYGSDILQQLDTENIFCARCIESPGSYPLSFLHGQEASKILRQWPRRQAIKVLAIQPPSIEDRGFQTQTQRLRQLTEACQEWGHQLILEIIPQKENYADNSPIPTMEAYYRAGVSPTWWKLMPNLSENNWCAAHSLIATHDPYCKGILVLGKNEPLEVLGETFSRLKREGPIAGFAIGRSIWSRAASHWLAGTMTDDEVIEDVAGRYLKTMKYFALEHAQV